MVLTKYLMDCKIIKKRENIAVTIGGSVVSEKLIFYIFAFACICSFKGKGGNNNPLLPWRAAGVRSQDYY